MLSAEAREKLITDLIDTNNSHSALSLLLVDDKLSPKRFAEHPEFKSIPEPSKALRDSLSDLFDIGQVQYNIQDGAWLVLLKNQIRSEVEAGLITTLKFGKDRIRELYFEFKDLIDKNSKDLQETKDPSDISAKLNELVVLKLPDLKTMVSQLNGFCTSRETQIILTEFKSQNVSDNLSRLLIKFTDLNNQIVITRKSESKSDSKSESPSLQSFTQLIQLFSNTLKVVTTFKPETTKDTLKLGLLIVAMNETCKEALEKKNYAQSVTTFVGYVRWIKNQDDNLQKIKSNLTSLMTKVKSFKNTVRDTILKPSSIEYKKIKELNFNKKILDQLTKQLEKKEDLKAESISKRIG